MCRSLRLGARGSRSHPLQRLDRLRLPRIGQDMEITPTSDTVMAVALVLCCANAANSEGLLDGVISLHLEHQSWTDEQHEVIQA
jgi:hypothetical protein